MNYYGFGSILKVPIVRLINQLENQEYMFSNSKETGNGDMQSSQITVKPEYVAEEEGKQHIEVAEEDGDREYVDAEKKEQIVSNGGIKNEVEMVVGREEFHEDCYGKLGKNVEEIEKEDKRMREEKREKRMRVEEKEEKRMREEKGVFHEELIIKNEYFDDDYNCDRNKPVEEVDVEEGFDETFIKEENEYFDDKENVYDDCIVRMDKDFETFRNDNVSVNVEDPLFQDGLMIKDEEYEYDFKYYEGNRGIEVEKEKVNDHDLRGSILNSHIGKKLHESNTCSRGLSQMGPIETGKVPYKCTTCKKCFNHMGNLIRHKSIHTRPYKCTTCNKGFSRKDASIRHERVHTGKKPYECTTCKKCFSDKGNLNRHKRLHTDNSRPYECQTCNKSFTDSGHLTRHKRTHIHKNPYKCSTCNENIFTKRHLIMHLRIHSAKTSFKCTTCSKLYSRESYLIRHEKIHLQKQ